MARIVRPSDSALRSALPRTSRKRHGRFVPGSRRARSTSVTPVAEDVQEGTGQEVEADKGHRTSLATRLAVVVLLVSISSILVSVLVSSNTIGNTADELIETRVKTRSNALTSEISSYFENATIQLQVLVASPVTPTVVREFSEAYGELAALDPDTLDDEAESLFTFYSEDFIPRLADVRGGLVDPAELIPGSEPAPLYLQAAYIAASPVDPVDRRLITDPGDGSAWTEVHKKFHPGLRQRIDRLGFDDLFLIDQTGSVVYSTNKDIAFSTNLVSGPHSGTSLAALARQVLATGEQGAIEAADVASYAPLLDLPSGFLAAPVFDGDDSVGVVVVSVDLDELSDIMTADWRDGRFGETGEAYLVGSDRTMRSDSRAFLENPTAYLLAVDEIGGVPADDRRRMEKLGTTVVFQPVDNDSVRAGLDGNSDLVETTNYLGKEVYSVHSPIAPDVFDWALMVEQEVEEANMAFSDYIQSILTITVVFVVALTFVAVWWAGRLVAPLRSMAASLRITRKEDAMTPAPQVGVTEFRELAGHLNDMVASLVERKEAVLRALRGKTAVLRTLLPVSALNQVTVEDRKFVETLPQASVAVIAMDGIDALFSSSDIDESRQFLTSLIRSADELATANDVERVKVSGAAYYAVSGLGTPHLDHAPRSVRFAVEVIRAMHAAAEEAGIELRVSAGVASGSVTAGLVGDSRLIFDLWGEPVDEAGRLARMSPPNTIYVSNEAQHRLPGGTAMTPVDLPHDETAWSLSADLVEPGAAT